MSDQTDKTNLRASYWKGVLVSVVTVCFAVLVYNIGYWDGEYDHLSPRPDKVEPHFAYNVCVDTIEDYVRASDSEYIDMKALVRVCRSVAG